MQEEHFKQQVYDTFNYLHAHPEISWEEENTNQFVKEQLEKAGCTVRTFNGSTGVIADFGDPANGNPVVAIRADMDALWQEVDGKFQANHSCGHDAHMTMVLGAVWKLTKDPSIKDKVTVRFIFQPAEEVGDGALKMVEKGAVDDVDYLFGIHLRPVQEAPDGYATPAIIHGAASSIECDIIGDDAHGARPHLTSNAIEVGTHIVNAINAIHLDPTVPHSVKVTKFHAGGKSTNIIPGQASLAFDLRAQTNQHMKMLKNKVYETLEATEQLFQSKIKITDDYGIPAAEVAPEAKEITEQAISNILGPDHTMDPLMTPGGDDFHFYTIKRPELKATMIGLGCDLKPGLHHPYMTFNREALFKGIDIITEVVQVLAKKGEN
ncbi:M20 peptidase aminoacylase family protein [Bacillus norwichensis]|uniref:M20 peptidase aminoacylase family protein n=1 Tax=Bacillus norwichensis TaxID=2762217 RepID=A0ABR8VIF3_9BACI|nr:M20 peptidase aminoacylase family protein [Bacillus norwichensis]MBD8004540.1 M20 peptidase aminoacylase family protein [Bacillus norwichensis]